MTGLIQEQFIGRLGDTNMGLFGGTKKPKPPPLPTLGAMGKEFQGEIFPLIQRGLQGEGLFPNLTAQTIRDLIGSTKESFLETRRDLPGTLARFIPRADFGVRDFISSSIDADFARQTQDIKDEFAFVGEEDKQTAQTLGFNTLSAEKRMSAAIANLYNQSLFRRSGSPTFESELFGGLGGAGGIALGNIGQNRPSVFSNQNTRFGADSSFGSGFDFTRNFSQSQFSTPAPVNFARGFNATP